MSAALGGLRLKIARAKDKTYALSKRISLPGFQKQSVYDVFSFFFRELQNNSLQVRATSVAYHFLLATFPSLLVLFTVIPYLPIPHLKRTVFTSLQQVLPVNGYQFIHSTLDDVLNHQHGGVLSIGILMSMYYSSRGVAGLMNSFDKAYPSFKKRSFINKLLVSYKITALLIILFILSILLIVADQWIVHLIFNHFGITSKKTFNTVMTIKWVAILLFFVIGISLIFYYGPSTHKRWKFFTPGSILAAALSISASLLFSYFMNHFGQLNKLYGSIGTLIIIMFWIYWNSLVLLIGYELNASIEINKHNKMLARAEAKNVKAGK